MLLRKAEAEEGLSQPERGRGAGVRLNQGGKGTIEAKARDPLIKHILSAQKLEERAGGNPAGKARILRRISEKEIRGKGAGRGISIDIASPPHIGISVPIEKRGQALHHLIGMLFEISGKLRFLPIAVPEIPKRSVDIEGPDRIVVKALSVPVPAISGVIV